MGSLGAVNMEYSHKEFTDKGVMLPAQIPCHIQALSIVTPWVRFHSTWTPPGVNVDHNKSYSYVIHVN